MIRTFALVLASAALTACTFDIVGPRAVLENLPGGLDVEFTVEPSEVSQHEPFTTQLRVTNTTSDTIRVVTAHGCLATPHVLRDGRRIPFHGSNWGCTAAITTHTFAPGASRVMTWNMRAELYAEHPGDTGGVPAPRGTYLVRAEFDTFSEDGPSRKPFVERTLRVR
jgi:hypothetical protein